MNNNIFSELEDLGFDNLKNIKIYEDNTEKKEKTENNPTQKSLLYDREIICPVCNNTFKAKSVKSSSYRIIKKDTDFFIRYEIINPYFYDVWLCNKCGYAAMKKDFKNIRNYQIDFVKQKITPKWKGKKYPEKYNLDIALQRYKLSLLNYCIIEAKPSKKAMNCLKIAWMYRLKEDKKNENIFLKKALEGFNDAFFNEYFPIYGMNKFTAMYLIGELNRKIDNNETALLWFSKVITSMGINKRLKEMARDQKDLIKSQQKNDEDTIDNFSLDKKTSAKKKGFFSKFFK